jgi:hypothetical protein
MLINKISKIAFCALALSMALAGCDKKKQPPLGDYPIDINPPGGPLKFFAAYDGSNVDSIRANYGVNSEITYVDGISGKAAQGTAKGYIVYPSANDFKRVSNFSVSFWVKKAGPNPAGSGTSFAFGLATSTSIWTSMDMFLEFEDAGNPSSADSASAKFYVLDQWFEFVQNRRMPKILNGQWHHLVFSFDQTTSMLTTYIDGAPMEGLPAGFGKFNNNGGKVDFSKSAGVVVGGAGHYAVGKTPDGWMGNFNGAIDQFRLYGVALTASEVNALYTGKK